MLYFGYHKEVIIMKGDVLMFTDIRNKFDPEMPPTSIRRVVVLSGTYEEMGEQYGEQAKEYLARNAAVVKGSVLPMWDSWEDIVKAMDGYEAVLKEKFPEALEMWKGMAKGSGLDYDDIRIINLSLALLVMIGLDPDEKKESLKNEACSTISAWGSSTLDGKLIAASNLDQGWNIGTYDVVLVGFPKDDYPFITTPPWAGELIGNMGINSQGLVAMGSAGQDSLPTDSAMGAPNLTAKVGALLKCETVEEAVDYYIDLHCGNAENAHFADETHSKVVEYTPGHHAVRECGQHGETDFMIATNHFIDKEMTSSLWGGDYNQGWYDAFPRYTTYYKLMEAKRGGITKETIESMITCHDYWDGDRWHEDVYSMEPEIDPESSWTPEMRSQEWRAQMQAIAIPSERTVYLRQGESDKRFSLVPYASGEFCKLVLGDDADAVYEEAYDEAKRRIWIASRDLNKANNTDYKKDECLDLAKEQMWTAFNYKAVADLSEGNEKNNAIGSAITCLCKAQIYAKMAGK